jgi:transcription elongation factor GreA
METQNVFLTEDGRQHALTQLEFLRTVKRAEIAHYLHDAQESGDVMDNAAYEDAKSEQARLEGRILELEHLLASAKPIIKRSTREIALGSVTWVRAADAREYRYTLVGAYEAKPSAGFLPHDSPVGKALIGHKVGDVVVVSTPGGIKEYTILRIE